MRKRARDFILRHRPTLSLARHAPIGPHTRLVVRPIANRRSAFDLIEEENLDYRPYSSAESYRSANVAVIPMHTADLGWVRDRVPWIVWKLAAAGRLALVLDRSGEGTPHRAKFTADLHTLLTEKHIDFSRCLLLTQNRVYQADYDAYCQATGVERGIAVFEYDYFISRFFHDFRERGDEVFRRRLSWFESRPTERERYFISLNYTIRPLRLLFLLRLMHDRLFESSFISFGGFKRSSDAGDDALDQDLSTLVHEPGFEDLARQLLPLVPELAARGQLVFGDVDRDANTGLAIAKRWAADLETDLYERTWFTAVTETEMAQRPIRITEKPLKPLVNFHFFVILGNPGSLALLRQLGFQTFDGVVDERYDNEPNPRKRFDLVYSEVQRLCGLDQAELRELEMRLRDVLIANARHGLLEMPRIYRERLNKVLLREVRATVGT